MDDIMKISVGFDRLGSSGDIILNSTRAWIPAPRGGMVA
jgi:hypothetical protein